VKAHFQDVLDEKGDCLMSNPIQFGPQEFVTPTVVSAQDVSVSPAPDDSAVAILFNNLVLALGAGCSELSAVSIATLRLPASLPEDKGLIGYLADLRGFVQKDAGSRAVLMVDLGGTSKVIEFPYDEELNEDYTHDLFSLERRNSKNEEPAALPIPPYIITLILSVERRTPDSSVQLTLDSLDIGVASAS
jgi:hypothetical protein